MTKELSYKKELDFITEAFKRCHLDIKILPTDEFGGAQDIAQNTLYKLTDVIGLQYIFFLMPETNASKILLIGPYTPAENSVDTYSSMIFLDVFCESIWGGKESYKTEVLDGEMKNNFSSLSLDTAEAEEYAFSYKMRYMENSYAMENELMEAIALGHTEKVDQFFPKKSKMAFEQRLEDNLRNTKNYLVIMNTLCRKAAEKGGVHPLYLNQHSSDFAKKIEDLTSTKDIQNFMRDIFKSYCKLVKKHSTSRYSSLVQKVVIYVDSNLSADLKLSELAKLLNVNSSYLSTLFRKETGCTLTDYVNSKRMDMAKYLLETTGLQIQAIAQKCGIIDVQYFSKIFKKYVGMSPREYRDNIK